MSLAPGAEIGPYRVIAPLGAGGMGEVYRAHDPRLGREVALKVLPGAQRIGPGAAAAASRRRPGGSALDHPNIVTIYDVGEHDGAPYIAMEFVAGRRAAGADRSPDVREALALADPDRRRARRGARARDRPPRPQARERDGDGARAGQGAGLRPGEARRGDWPRRPDVKDDAR